MDLQTAKAIPELDEVQVAGNLQEIDFLHFADEEPVRQAVVDVQFSTWLLRSCPCSASL